MSKNPKTPAKYAEVAEFLNAILKSKRTKNPKYSMRAFARDLKTSPGRISAILAGHALPGKIVRKRILSVLDMSPEKASKLEFLIGKYLLERKAPNQYFQVTEEVQTFLPEWHHFAILNLLENKDFRNDQHWISHRLNLDETIVSESIKKLILVGLAKEENGKLVPTHANITSTHDIPSEALKNYHRQMIKKSMEVLDEVPVDLRDVTSLILATNPRQIYKAKLLTKQYRQDMIKLLEEGDKTEVYSVCIQITPITKAITAV
ncbi:hypothetical protein DOM22_18090 [Bdellovibrio sp. ZAP7]|uniref:DUF4423 domain-containing protein n=1 Tax=Bdellovibrio sp. ZAP7 TaxID=2231053 RepID=UPI0011595E98|nr:DUF4423 domain-containing protein [Bdellovibrio sp. ZAP7]QDK46931.1 hypothetical protein DOM22_18090 [Bdellovibrio sp. ZAP7]